MTGSLAGAIAGAITTPLDLMKTLLQTQQQTRKKGSITRPEPTTTPSTSIVHGPASATSAPPAPKHYNGIMEGMIWNYQNQGLAGLFRGLGPRVFWTSLQSAVMFVVFEQILHVEKSLRERGDWPPSKPLGIS